MACRSIAVLSRGVKLHEVHGRIALPSRTTLHTEALLHDHDHAHQHHPAQQLPLSLVILSILLLAGLGILGRLVVPQVQAQVDPSQETVDARVIEVVEEGTLNQGGVQQPYQKLRLEILSGQRAGRAVSVDYGTQGFGSSAVIYRADDQVQVMHVTRADGGDAYFITEPNRSGPLLTLLLVFVVVIIAVSRWKGVRSLLGLGVSLFVITQFILPLILAGYP